MRQDLSEGAGATDYPPMVLLHGIFGKPADWDECERYFDGSCEVFAPRLPMASVNRAQRNLEQAIFWI
jgi:pimeloyl-ACP methyl ester carboxylesterase